MRPTVRPSAFDMYSRPAFRRRWISSEGAMELLGANNSEIWEVSECWE